MSSSSKGRLLTKVEFFNDQHIVTVAQLDFLWTLDMAVRLEFFQQSTLFRLVKHPVKFVLLVRATDCIFIAPLSSYSHGSIYFWGGVGKIHETFGIIFVSWIDFIFYFTV